MSDPSVIQQWARSAGLADWDLEAVWESRTSTFTRLKGSGGAHNDVLVRCQDTLGTGHLSDLYRIYVWAHDGFSNQTRPVSVPEPIAYDDATNALILAFVPGTTATEALREAISRQEWAQAGTILDTCASAMAAFHCLPAPGAMQVPWERKRDARHGQPESAAIRFGDFSLNNLLLTDQGCCLIDLPESLRVAPASRDIASLIFRVRRLPEPAPAASGPSQNLSVWMVERFIASYAQEMSLAVVPLTQEVLREEARRALTIARKRVKSRRLGSARGYVIWAAACFAGKHPRPRADLLR